MYVYIYIYLNVFVYIYRCFEIHIQSIIEPYFLSRFQWAIVSLIQSYIMHWLQDCPNAPRRRSLCTGRASAHSWPSSSPGGNGGMEGIEWINLIGSNSFIQFVYIGILLLHGPFNASLWFNILYHILKYFHHFFN